MPRQTAAQQRSVILDRVVPIGRAGIEDELGLLGITLEFEREAVADFQIAVGADMQAAATERRIEGIVAPL